MVEDAVGKEPGLVVDPFAGSGTTLGEALRLGHRAIGVEINFFAATLTKEAFAKRHNELADTYRVITSEALSEVEPFYNCAGSTGPSGYFWAHEQQCFSCGKTTLLMKRHILVSHAYPKKHPLGWALCPYDRQLFRVNVNRESALCPCGNEIPLRSKNGLFRCTFCAASLSPGSSDSGVLRPPDSVLIAVERRAQGERIFTIPGKDDLALAHSADALNTPLFPMPIINGPSTEQVLRWGYRNWGDLLHPRQRLLAYAISKRVSQIEDSLLRQQLAISFSPFFEYHCRLASFKGIGSGTVRQAFGRPLLHPVSVSFEINPVYGNGEVSISGDPRSWYAMRTAPAAHALTMLAEKRGSDVTIGDALDVVAGEADVAIVRANSADVIFPPASIDAIVTDPPYFDRVHYDDLAGAFTAWLAWCGLEVPPGEQGIQAEDPNRFSEGIFRSLQSSVRGLKSGGKILFTFHHQELNAWVALAKALAKLPVSGRDLVLVPSEMPNALIKQRALAPIACDAVLSLAKDRAGQACARAAHRRRKRDNSRAGLPDPRGSLSSGR